MKYILPISSLLLFFQLSLADTQSVVQREFMDVSRAEKRWGITKFESKRFREANPSIKASMAVDALKRQLFRGMSRKEARAELGDPDGYFFSDLILAYQIELLSDSNRTSWQLVLIPMENDPSKIGEVRIHKRCCYE